MASKRRLRQRQCGKKVGHSTVQAAQTAVRRIRKKHGVCDVAPYRCRWCHKWHLGHAPGFWQRNAVAAEDVAMVVAHGEV